jgi:sugar/nucleoside kinase (ribokinase family)
VLAEFEGDEEAIGQLLTAAQVSAVGVVGDDGVGRDVLTALARERVDGRWVEVRKDVATTVCLSFVSDDGHSAIIWHIDDDVAVTPETVHRLRRRLRVQMLCW